jgi:glycosyltransferase involved in cell wall biosynthesis
MKIGIDISQIVYQGTGVAAYTSSLVKAMIRTGEEKEFVLFGSSLRNRQPLKQFARSLEGEDFRVKFSFLPPKVLEFLWNGIHTFPVENFTGEVDVFHSSDWLEPPARQAKKVTTIHDLAVFKYPEAFSVRGGHDIVKNQKRKLHFVKRETDLVIAVSETTKKDIIEILGIPDKRIRVIYEAADPVFKVVSPERVDQVKEKYQLSHDYFLCVGTREPRKNLDRVVMAFAEIASASSDFDLVIAGKYGWGEGDCLAHKAKDLKARVKILGYVEQSDLVGLYNGATAFIYPSLYEGFGLPILEAMSCGCPVITSSVGAMAEIAGGVALLVEPERIESIAGAMSKARRNVSTREDLKIKGLERAGQFSWEKAALETLNVYRELIE